MSIEDFRSVRIEKLKKLRDAGMDPYPAGSGRTHSVVQVIDGFDALAADRTKITVAGRVLAQRGHGALTFLDIDDGTGTVQVLFKRDALGEEQYDFFVSVIDVGDIVQVSGTAFLTKRNERTIETDRWAMLTKSIRPLPEKWHGLQDVDERFRKRYIDLLMNPGARDIFRQKARFWDATREFLRGKGFLEVETPTLEITTGGAEARPFKTHHNDFDLDLYLRISIGELWQKRLMAAGFPRTFEIGRAYRNEGTSPEHAQEFTNCESYAAYMEYQEAMDLYEEMLKSVVKSTFGTMQFSTRGHSFDLSGAWERLEYVPTVEKITGINVLTASDKDIEERLQSLGVEYDGKNRERLTDSLWKYCRKQINGPAWLINHPRIISPLAKAKPDNPELTERFQLILAGSECANGYSELNDPIDQHERFELQKKLIEKGDIVAMMPDDEFVEMLEYGMPPTTGFGFGERLFTFLVDKPLRESQLFPLMRPKS